MTIYTRGADARRRRLAGLGFIDLGDGWGYDEFGDLVPVASGGGTGDTGIFGSGVSFDQAARFIKDLWLTGQQAEAQQRIIELNMQRARSGLQPLPATYFQPSARVNVGMSQDTKTLLLWGAVGIGGFLLLRELL